MRKVATKIMVATVVLVFGMGGILYATFRPEIQTKIAQKQQEYRFEQLDVSQYKERVNVLLLGVDSLQTDTNQKGTRTDTIMILSVDPVTNTGFLLSIPRDSYVKISGTNNYTKINHAHSYGGSSLAIATIKEFIQLPIHHYIKVDYQALFKTIDDLGGVEFDVPQDMKYTDKRATPPLLIDLKKGVQMIDADKAMQLLRFREGYADRDLGRVRVQQDFIKAVLKKMYQPASIAKIPKFVETIHEYVETDMSITDMMSLLKLGRKINFEDVEKKTLPGMDDRKPGVGSVVLIDEEAMAEMLAYLLSGDYNKEEAEAENLPDSTAISQTQPLNNSNADTDDDPDQSTSANQSPSDPSVVQKNSILSYKIVILNGSGYSGVARRATDLLKIQDIPVHSAENADSFDHEYTTITYREDAQAAEMIRDILRVGSIKKDNIRIKNMEPDIVILLGKDFHP